MRILFISFVLFISLVFSAHAEDSVGVELPEGETVIDLAWLDTTELMILVNSGGNLALRHLDIASGDISVVSVPRSFTRHRMNDPYISSADYRFSPDGKAIAILERASNPVEVNDLSIYGLNDGEMVKVNLRYVPNDFWPNQICWDQSGEYLFISSVEYLNYKQSFSIGVLNVKNNEFGGLVKKDSIDQVEQLAFIPGSQVLCAIAGGFQGNYPESNVLALITGEEEGEYVLHSDINSAMLTVLADGRLVVFDESENDTWVLESDAKSLVKAKPINGLDSGSLAATADGSWMGYINSDQQLILERSNDGKTVITDEKCSVFRFSAASDYVCLADLNGETLYFYQLPKEKPGLDPA